jgi:hypothetical protein
MVLGPEWQRLVTEARAELAAMSPEECVGCAGLLRDVKPSLTSERQREIAEEIARDFEARAAASSQSG